MYCDICKKLYTNPNAVHFFSFPLSNPAILEQWLKSLQMENFKSDSNTRICSLHFSEKDIVKDQQSIRLKTSAIPVKQTRSQPFRAAVAKNASGKRQLVPKPAFSTIAIPVQVSRQFLVLNERSKSQPVVPSFISTPTPAVPTHTYSRFSAQSSNVIQTSTSQADEGDVIKVMVEDDEIFVSVPMPSNSEETVIKKPANKPTSRPPVPIVPRIASVAAKDIAPRIAQAPLNANKVSKTMPAPVNDNVKVFRVATSTAPAPVLDNVPRIVASSAPLLDNVPRIVAAPPPVPDNVSRIAPAPVPVLVKEPIPRTLATPAPVLESMSRVPPVPGPVLDNVPKIVTTPVSETVFSPLVTGVYTTLPGSSSLVRVLEDKPTQPIIPVKTCRVVGNGHTECLRMALKDSWNKQNFTNVVFLCKIDRSTRETLPIRANASILAAASPFFAKILRDFSSLDEDAVVFLPDYTKNAVSCAIQFIYTGNVAVKANSALAEEIQSLLKELGIISGWEKHVESQIPAKNQQKDNRFANIAPKNVEIPVPPKPPVLQMDSDENIDSNDDVSFHSSDLDEDSIDEDNIDSEDLLSDLSILSEDSVPKRKPKKNSAPLKSKKINEDNTKTNTNSAESPEAGSKEPEAGREEREAANEGPEEVEFKEACELLASETVKKRKLQSVASQLEEEVKLFRKFQRKFMNNDPKLKSKKKASARARKSVPVAEQEKVVCEECGKLVPKNGLSSHKSYHEVGNYPCEVCGKVFRLRRHLRLHATVHTGEKKYKCRYCDRTFRLDNIRKNHQRTHTGEKPHKCRICDRGFAQRTALMSHVKTHEAPKRVAKKKDPKPKGRPYFQCDMCPAKFGWKTYLIAHKAKHTGEPVELPCDNCSEVFATFKDLHNHRVEAHSSKTVLCDICGKIFVSRATYFLHKKKHKEMTAESNTTAASEQQGEDQMIIES